MVQQSYSPDKESRVLWQIREGMVVYDWDDKKVGTVKYVQFPNEMKSDEDIVGSGLERLPENLEGRLSREGYIRVSGGFFSPDRYILPGQILEVSDNQIILSVLKSEVIQF